MSDTPDQPSSTPRHFIAGAVCPECGEVDKLVMYQQAGQSWRECVRCDFKEEMNFQAAPSPLETRVERTEEQVVRLVDPTDGET